MHLRVAMKARECSVVAWAVKVVSGVAARKEITKSVDDWTMATKGFVDLVTAREVGFVSVGVLVLATVAAGVRWVVGAEGL